MPQPRLYTNDAARQRAYRDRQRQARHQLAAQGLPPSAAIPTMPSRERWHELMEQARIALQTAQEEMQAYWDDRSQAWQESDRGEVMSAHMDALEEVTNSIIDLAVQYSR